MACDDVIERLPWLANGTLAAEEEAAVRAHLEGCPSCRRELAATIEEGRLFGAHPATETLVAMAYGELDPAARRRVEGHLEGCEACRDELALAAAGAGLESVAPTPGVEAGPRRPPRTTLWALAASFAALALLGVALFLAWQTHQRAERWARERSRLELEVARLEAPRAGLPVLELLPDSVQLRGGGAEPPAVGLPGDAPWVTVLLSAPGVPADGSYRIELRAGGETVWRSEPTAPDELGGFSVLLPTSRLRGGAHTLAVVAAAGPPGAAPLVTYRLD